MGSGGLGQRTRHIRRRKRRVAGRFTARPSLSRLLTRSSILLPLRGSRLRRTASSVACGARHSQPGHGENGVRRDLHRPANGSCRALRRGSLLRLSGGRMDGVPEELVFHADADLAKCSGARFGVRAHGRGRISASPLEGQSQFPDRLPTLRDAVAAGRRANVIVDRRPSHGWRSLLFQSGVGGRGDHRRPGLAWAVGGPVFARQTKRRARLGGTAVDPFPPASGRGGAHSSCRAAVLAGRLDRSAKRLAALDDRTLSASAGRPSATAATGRRQRTADHRNAGCQ